MHAGNAGPLTCSLCNASLHPHVLPGLHFSMGNARLARKSLSMWGSNPHPPKLAPTLHPATSSIRHATFSLNLPLLPGHICKTHIDPGKKFSL